MKMFFNLIKIRPHCFGLRCRSISKNSVSVQENHDDVSNVQILPNGLRIVSDPTRSFMSGIGLYIRAGPRHENTCNNGVSHLISHLAFKGTKSLSKEKLDQFCLEKNVRFNTHTYRDMLALRAFFIDPECAGSVFEILSTIVKEFAFDKDAFEKEKYNMCIEAVDYEYNPRKLVFDYLHQAAFQCTSMGQTRIGTSANFANFNTKIVSDFVAQQFQPDNIVIATAGLNKENVIGYAKEAFQKDSDECDPSYYGRRFVASDIRYRDDSMPYVHVAFAVEAPGYGHEDFFPMLMAKELLGSWHRSQGGGYNNRYLAAQASSIAGLSYFYEPFYLAYCDVGLWGVYYVSDMLAADDMLSNIQDAFMKMVVMSNENDVQLGILLARRELERRKSNVYKRVHDAAMQVMYTNKRKSFPADYSKVLQMLGKKDYFRNVIDNYIYDRSPAVAAIGPTECVPDMVRIAAGMWWFRY